MCIVLSVQMGTDSYRFVINSLNCTYRQLFKAALISNGQLIKAVVDVPPFISLSFGEGILCVSS